MSLKEELEQLSKHLSNARHSLDQAEEIANENNLSFSFESYVDDMYEGKELGIDDYYYDEYDGEFSSDGYLL